MTPEEVKAERAALERAIEQRQRQIDADKMQQWCAEREAAKGADNIHTPVTRSAPVRAGSPRNLTTEWKDYINRVNEGWIEAAMEAVGQKLAEQRDRMSEIQRQMREEMQEHVRREIDKTAQRLRSESLQSQLDFERSLRTADQQRRHQGAGLPVSEMIDVSPRRDVN